MVDQKKLSVSDYIGFIKHISYLAEKDKCDRLGTLRRGNAHITNGTGNRDMMIATANSVIIVGNDSHKKVKCTHD